MLQMKLLHASLKEYVMIWGTPIRSEGHTGRHLVEFYDTVLGCSLYSPLEAWYISLKKYLISEIEPSLPFLKRKEQKLSLPLVMRYSLSWHANRTRAMIFYST